MEKRICFLTAGVHPVPATDGGAVENLVQMMLDCYQDGEYPYKIDVISIDSDKAQCVAEKYEKIRFFFLCTKLWRRKFYQFAKRLCRKMKFADPCRLDPFFVQAKKILKKQKYDIVIVENKPVFALALKKCIRSKIVIHLHNDYLNASSPYAYKTIQSTDLILAVSDYIKTRVLEVKPDARVVTVKNVIDIDRFAEADCDDLQIRSQFGFASDDIVCIFTGRLVPDKGVDKLLSAMERICDEKVKLLIVGGDSYADSRETEYVQKLKRNAQKMHNRVHFSGFVDYACIAAYYHMADIAVFPSQWEEPAGLVNIEAQICGKPVIISDAGGMREYVTSDSAVIVKRGEGFVENLALAISKLANDAQLRKSMGRCGFLYARKFDKAAYLKNTMLYVLGE